MKAVFWSVFCFIFLQCQLITSQKVEIQYLANEGILIKTDETQILVDAIFKKEFDYLDVLPDAELKKIEEAEDPYKSIDIILFTHLHGDHFNAQITGKHLTINKKALFFGPNETVVNFKNNFEGFQNIASRVKSETPNLFESKNITLNSIKITVLRLEHFGDSPWKEAENVAYLIFIEDKKILHLGDSNIDMKNLEKFNLANEDIDIAILPYWQLGSDQQKNIIENYIRPKQILVAHIPLKSQAKAQENIDGLGYKNTTALIEQFKTTIIE